jgi:hypothetical protein
MPIYEVEIPGQGKFRVESETELTDDQVISAVMEQPARTTPQELTRQVGLTARGALTGLTSPLSIIGDPLNQLINMIAGTNLQPVSQASQQLMTQAGLPQAETSRERVVQDIVSAMGGVAGTAGAARALLPRQAAAPLTERLGLQATGAAGGATAASLGREEGVGPLGQIGLAAMGGMMAPTATSTLTGAAARGGREIVRPFTEAGREKITGEVLRSLSANPEAAMARAGTYQAPLPGYRPTTAQATRDVGLISAETPIRGLDTTGRFATQAAEANRVRNQILDRLAKDQDALAAAIAKRDEVTTPLRENAFAQAVVDPDTFKSAVTLTVNKTIDDILASPAGKRGTVENAMKFAQSRISRATTPAELYEVRKDLRDAAQGLLDKEGAAFSLAKGQLESVIRSVDDAIDSAAPGYKDYLSKYATASKGIERLEAAQIFRSKVLSTTPDPSNIGDFLISQPAFTRAIRAVLDDPQMKGLSKTQVGTLQRVGRDLDEGVLARAAKVPGSDTFKNLSTANVIGGIIGKQIFGEVPAALQKVAAPMNWLYNGTDDKIRELLVEAMLDPKLASRLMAKASETTMEPLSRELQRKAINMGYGSIFGLEQ